MRYIKTTNFDKFKCIADHCPSSCCEGWQIMIDEESLDKYSKLKGDFGQLVKNSVDWSFECFLQCDGRCANLDARGLCRLITEGGEDMLCYTCREYPRHTEEYEGVRERSLSLSCPEAARIMLSNKERLGFIEEEDDEEDDFEEFDYLMYTKLMDAREVMYKLIQNRKLKFTFKASVLAKLGEELQGLIESGEMYRMDEIIAEFDHKLSQPELLRTSDKWMDKSLFDVLDRLEVLLPAWPEVVARTKRGFSRLTLSEDEEIMAEQLLMFFIYTYFCGAVYDDSIMSKVYLAVCSVYWIFQIDRARERSNIIETAYTYAREVEHSDLNLNDIEDWFNEQVDIS